ncbi:MAG TPA: hypothetical protein VFW87_25835 [Pirellulales bacterium]|nr:hypothetical protein [Pirellulales bacterium]
MQRDVNQHLFEIEPLEERIAPSTLAMGGETTAHHSGGGETQNVYFIGYDPPPPQTANAGSFFVYPS